MGSITKIKTNGVTKYRACVRKKALGKTKTKMFATETAAEKWIRELELEADGISVLAKGKLGKTVKEVREEYMASPVFLNKAPRTQETELDCSKYLLEDFGDRPVNTVTFAMMDEWALDLQTKKNKFGQPISISHVRNSFRALSQIFNYARRKRYCETNPCLGVVLPEAERRVVRIDPWVQILIFRTLHEMRSPRVHRPKHQPLYFFNILAELGARPGELAQMKWREVSFENRLIKLAKTKTDKNRGFISERILRFLKLQRDKCLELEMACDPDDYVFPSYDKEGNQKPYDYREGWKVVQRVLGKDALRIISTGKDGSEKITEITPYAFRHEFASRMLELGADIKEVADFLNHSSIKMVSEVYAHVAPEHQRKRFEQLSENRVEHIYLMASHLVAQPDEVLDPSALKAKRKLQAEGYSFERLSLEAASFAAEDMKASRKGLLLAAQKRLQEENKDLEQKEAELRSAFAFIDDIILEEQQDKKNTG